MALLLAKDSHQHIDDADFFLASRLHMKHSPLQHPLEAQRRLHFAVITFRQFRRGFVDV